MSKQPRPTGETDAKPFAGIEPYYERLFQQIVDRREDNPPLGTGGDLDCLIAMVRWLWERYADLRAEITALRAELDQLRASKLEASAAGLRSLLRLKDEHLAAAEAEQERLRKALEEAQQTIAGLLGNTDTGNSRG